jgi:uncharacterized membrane protein
LFGFGWEAWIVPVIAGAALLIIASAAAWWIARARERKATAAALSDAQRETLADFEAQVTALIAQRGGRVAQTAVSAALGLPAKLVAERLLELGRSGAIEREWSVDRMICSIRRPAA